MVEKSPNSAPFSAETQPIARIIIVCFNSEAVLPRCLKHLAEQTRRDFEVVIINNDPTDVSFMKTRLPDGRFKIIEPGDNLGFAQGSNLGARGAQTKWLITLNPDAFPATDWFKALMAGGHRHPEAAALGSALISADEPSKWDGLGDCYSIFGIAWRGAQGWQRSALDIGSMGYPILSPCGAAAAYKTAVFRELGGFDDDYFCYLEDLDLGLRLALSGHKSILIPKAKALHLGGHSTSDPIIETSKFSSEFALYYSHRNAIRLMIKSMPSWGIIIGTLGFVLGQIWVLFRTSRQPHAAARRKGLRTGLKHVPDHWRARKTIRGKTKISTLDFFRKISWNPKSLRRKTPSFYEE